MLGLLRSSPGVFSTSVGRFRRVGRRLRCVGILLSFCLAVRRFSEHAHKSSGTLSAVLSFKPRGKSQHARCLDMLAEGKCAILPPMK